MNWSYKEASNNNKQKGLFSSLIEIIDFVEKFNLENKKFRRKTKTICAIQDKQLHYPLQESKNLSQI